MTAAVSTAKLSLLDINLSDMVQQNSPPSCHGGTIYALMEKKNKTKPKKHFCSSQRLLLGATKGSIGVPSAP